LRRGWAVEGQRSTLRASGTFSANEAKPPGT
jgi:hypothetical protein